MNSLFRLKRFVGALLFDYPRFAGALRNPDRSYLGLCNRNESLEISPDGMGYRCLWQWNSNLDAPTYFPSLGMRLMKRALSDHPVARKRTPEKPGELPEISFIIGHRGVDRLPHLLATLESIAGQTGAVVECIVVEQDSVSRLDGKLPGWVRHILTPPPATDMPYCRSWAFNVGVRQASAEVLVLHDNDLLVSADYSARILEKVRSDFEVVNLKRFIFYLTEKDSAKVFFGNPELSGHAPTAIMQNSEGGGSIAITKKAYETIGGFDESFIGWGGEDNEFWERATTCRVYNYAYLPLVHLWHAAQPGKSQADNQTLMHYRSLSAMPVQARINHLRGLPSGQDSGPLGWKRRDE